MVEKFQKCYQYCFLHVQRSFFRFLKNYKFLFSFRIVGENVSAFCLETFRHGCQNFIPRVWENVLRKMNCFEKKVFSYFFGIWAEIFRVFGAIFRGMVFKSAFRMSRINFRGEVFIGITVSAETFEFFPQFFQGFCEKKHKQFCQNCILIVQ